MTELTYHLKQSNLKKSVYLLFLRQYLLLAGPYDPFDQSAYRIIIHLKKTSERSTEAYRKISGTYCIVSTKFHLPRKSMYQERH